MLNGAITLRHNGDDWIVEDERTIFVFRDLREACACVRQLAEVVDAMRKARANRIESKAATGFENWNGAG